MPLNGLCFYAKALKYNEEKTPLFRMLILRIPEPSTQCISKSAIIKFHISTSDRSLSCKWPNHVDRTVAANYIIFSLELKQLFKKIPLTSNHHLIILVSVFDWGKAGYFFKGVSKCFTVGIANTVHHFVNVFSTGFEVAFCRFYFYPIDVFQHRIVRGNFKPPFKTSSSY